MKFSEALFYAKLNCHDSICSNTECKSIRVTENTVMATTGRSMYIAHPEVPWKTLYRSYLPPTLDLFFRPVREGKDYKITYRVDCGKLLPKDPDHFIFERGMFTAGNLLFKRVEVSYSSGNYPHYTEISRVNRLFKNATWHRITKYPKKIDAKKVKEVFVKSDEYGFYMENAKAQIGTERIEIFNFPKVNVCSKYQTELFFKFKPREIAFVEYKHGYHHMLFRKGKQKLIVLPIVPASLI